MRRGVAADARHAGDSARRRSRSSSRRDRRADGSVGLRQDDDAARDRRARAARWRRGVGGEGRHGVPVPLPLRASHRDRQREAGADPRRARRRRGEAARAGSCSISSASAIARTALPRELSGGEAQRVAIARALAVDPPLLLMDEPTASLDPARRNELGETLVQLARSGRTLVMTSHDDDFVRDFATRVVVLADGRSSSRAIPRRVLDVAAPPGDRGSCCSSSAARRGVQSTIRAASSVVEHLTFNQVVVGSIPTGPTRLRPDDRCRGYVWASHVRAKSVRRSEQRGSFAKADADAPSPRTLSRDCSRRYER